jgi:pimeloyl-ACP methyl ester carboxylesterase
LAFYETGRVRIHYQEAGSGFPFFVMPGGGQNSTIDFMSDRAPFNAITEFQDEYRCITADLRNAPSGQSSGPLEIDRPWDSYADDHLALMDHLGIRRFMVIGYCIGARSSGNWSNVRPSASSPRSCRSPSASARNRTPCTTTACRLGGRHWSSSGPTSRWT